MKYLFHYKNIFHEYLHLYFQHDSINARNRQQLKHFLFQGSFHNSFSFFLVEWEISKCGIYSQTIESAYKPHLNIRSNFIMTTHLPVKAL